MKIRYYEQEFAGAIPFEYGTDWPSQTELNELTSTGDLILYLGGKLAPDHETNYKA